MVGYLSEALRGSDVLSVRFGIINLAPNHVMPWGEKMFNTISVHSWGFGLLPVLFLYLNMMRVLQMRSLTC